MAHITLKNEHLPGISGLLDYAPDTAAPLCDLAEALLRAPSTLTSGEREIIASSVSWWNQCEYCHNSHGAAAAAHLERDVDLVYDIRAGLVETPVSDKLRALLEIARKVQQGGKAVAEEDIANARAQGATDREIHDTVLIAAAFCMYNRYVDGLGTWGASDAEAYRESGNRLAKQGYLQKK